MEPIQIQPVETEQLLEEAIAAAHKWEAEAGDEETRGKAEEAFKMLQNGQIKLDNPEAFIQRLRPKDFEEQGLELLPDIKNSMQGRAGFKLTEQSFKTLRDENIPEDILKNLKPLENEEFIDEEKFLDAVKEQIGKEQTATDT